MNLSAHVAARESRREKNSNAQTQMKERAAVVEEENQWSRATTNFEDSNETFFEYSSSEHGSVGNANFYDAKLDSETIKIPD